jgi:uncharacterized protein (DUF302 family)
MPHASPILAATLALALAATALPADAQTDDAPVTRAVQAEYDDVIFELENAITDAGLLIDSVNHVGEMLERTKTDVGGTQTIFTHAQVFGFCSAAVSRQVMEADPLNLQHCPYRIFVMERPEAPGTITVGHPSYPSGSMDAVNALLDGILDAALAGY